jgi:L-ribulokinase
MDVTADGSENYVIGVDYGTLSGRAVVVRVRDGKELGSGVFDYPHAVVTAALPADVADTADGTAARLPGEWALQVPNDYRDVLRHAVPAAIADAGIDAAAVVGIATDFTACTMVPVKAQTAPR